MVDVNILCVLSGKIGLYRNIISRKLTKIGPPCIQ